VGKTTMLEKLMTPDRRYVSLDDLTHRSLARTDPAARLSKVIATRQKLLFCTITETKTPRRST
jgi:hypothetical protein